MNEKTISPELREQIRRDRQAIEAELPELEERHTRMVEAKQEETFSGQLRRVIHGSGRLVREIAADAGIPSEHLAEFLEGTRTLRSDVLERVVQAVPAEVVFSPRTNTSTEQHRHKRVLDAFLTHHSNRWNHPAEDKMRHGVDVLRQAA